MAKSHQELPDRNARNDLHCASGGRGAFAVQSLQGMGYTNVARVDERINAWRKGYEVETDG